MGWDMMGAEDREVFEKEETGKLYLKEEISWVFVSIRAWLEVYAYIAWPVTSLCPVDSSCFMQICY